MCVQRECAMRMFWWILERVFYNKKNVLFFLFCFFFFCHEYSLALEVVLGLAFFYNRCTSPDRVREKKRVSGSSQMNLCKWLFDNEASLICQLCLYKQTLPCKASQSLESADMTEEIKRVFLFCFFSLTGLEFDFDLRSWVQKKKKKKRNKVASPGSRLSDSVVWSVVLYGFVCAVFFAFSEMKTAHFWAMFLCQVVSPQYRYYSVTMVYYITFEYSYWMFFFFPVET